MLPATKYTRAPATKYTRVTLLLDVLAGSVATSDNQTEGAVATKLTGWLANAWEQAREAVKEAQYLLR